jgi:hypothetical protein
MNNTAQVRLNAGQSRTSGQRIPQLMNDRR